MEPGNTASSPLGSTAAEPVGMLSRMVGGVPGAKLVSTVVGTQWGTRSDHLPFWHCSDALPRSLYMPSSRHRACRTASCGNSRCDACKKRTVAYKDEKYETQAGGVLLELGVLLRHVTWMVTFL